LTTQQLSAMLLKHETWNNSAFCMFYLSKDMKFLKLMLSVLYTIICIFLLLKRPTGLIIMGLLAYLYSALEAIYWQYLINTEREPKKVAIAEEKLRKVLAWPFIPLTLLVLFLVLTIFL